MTVVENLDGEDEIDHAMPPASAAPASRAVSAPGLDLSGKPKLWFDTALYAMRVRMLAYLAGIGLGLCVGGAVVGGMGVWYAREYVPTNYVRLVQPEQPARPMATQPRGK